MIAEILAIAKDGNLKTRIMYGANPRFAQLNEYLNFLLKRQLVKVDTENARTLYRTTSKEVKYLENYETISNLLRRKRDFLQSLLTDLLAMRVCVLISFVPKIL